MDPDLYTALPPDQKEEYKKTFHKPVNIEITRHIIDSCGNVWLFKDWVPLTIPEEWLSVTKKLEEQYSIDQIIHPRICIDDSVPDGYARIGDQYFELPDAQTRTSTELHKTRYLTSSEGYISHFKSDGLGALASIPYAACGASSMGYREHEKVQSEIGLSPGEQRLIKKGVV